MINLIERLRDEPSWYHIRRHGLPLLDCKVWHKVCCEAADEIEHLNKDVDGLMELLRKEKARAEALEGVVNGGEYDDPHAMWDRACKYQTAATEQES